MNLGALARPTMQVNLWASLGYGVFLLQLPTCFAIYSKQKPSTLLGCGQ